MTKRVIITEVNHGGFSQESTHNITQHGYAGGHSGYIEVLQIHDCPAPHKPFIVHEFNLPKLGGYRYSEWEKLEDATNAFEIFMATDQSDTRFPELPGFLQFVDCKEKKPWFYDR